MRVNTILTVLYFLAGPASGAFCNSFSTGPVANGTFIRAANSTLVVPAVPHPQKGLLSLWTGMGTSNGDLVQALVESYNGTADEGCGLLNGKHWCTYASTLKTTRGQIGGKEVVINPGDHVKMSYIHDEKTKKYNQFVYVNGKRVSALKTRSGHALGWGTAEECQPEQPCGFVPAHDWIDTVLQFDKPDPSYSTTVAKSNSTGHLTTMDKGKTWTAARSHIDACDFDFAPSS